GRAGGGEVGPADPARESEIVMADTKEKEPKQGRAADPGAVPRGEPAAEQPAVDPGTTPQGQEPKVADVAPAEAPAAPKPKQKEKQKGKKPAEGKPAAPAEPEGPPPEPAPRARLLDYYERQVRAKLTQQFGLKNPHQIPKLVKIVLNVGIVDATKKPKGRGAAVAELGASWGCPSGAKPRSRSVKGESPGHGQEGVDGEGQAEAEVQGAGVLPVPALRAQSRHAPEVQAVPHLFPGARAARGDSWRAQGQLVKDGTRDECD